MIRVSCVCGRGRWRKPGETHLLLLQSIVDGRVELELLCPLNSLQADDYVAHNLAVRPGLRGEGRNQLSQNSATLQAGGGGRFPRTALSVSSAVSSVTSPS